MKTQRIAITGGSGHLGNCLIELLLSQGYLVNALHSNRSPIKKNKNLTWINGDINDAKAINTLIQNCEVLIHSAGLISIGSKNKDQVYRVNVTGTETVINECAKFSPIRLIHISSSNAVKECNANGIFNENRPYKNDRDFIYPYTKALSEQLILKAVESQNLDAVIIRPTSIVGPADNKPSLLGQTILDLSQNKMPAITTGGYDLVDVRDLSQTIINSFVKGKKGEVYLIGGQYMTVKEIANASNSTKIPIELPLDLLLFLMPLINIYQKLFHLKWPITKESLVTLKLAPKHMDISKAKKELDHKCRPIDESIEDLLNWFQQKQQ
jgi:dihydroflavonol-4-reductase